MTRFDRALASTTMLQGADPPGVLIRDLAARHGPQTLFDRLDLDLPAGSFTVLLGPSGVGKTSLLRIIAGLQRPQAGSIVATDGGSLRQRVAWMGQQDLLFPWLSALRNVMLGAGLRGERPDPARAMRLLDQVGLADRARALPTQLSGGMRQRVALARTLYEDRPIVLMDEPFSALDSITRTRVQDAAALLLAGRTVLLITHDPMEACRLGQRLVVLSGSPARLAAPITIDGPAPRLPDDPALLATQGRLLRALSGGPAA